MKDVSDGIIGCIGDAQNRTFPGLDNICLEKSISSVSCCEDCDTSRTLPEFSNAWGDFEGFSEFTPQSEQFYYADEALELNSFTTATSDEEHLTEYTGVQDGWDPFSKDDDRCTEDCEQIFKLNFPASSVEETSEDVKNLDTLLASTSSDGNVVSQLLKSHCLDGDRSEKAGDILPRNPGCDWQNSKGCRDLMSLLCISAENMSVNKDDIAEVKTDFDVEQSQVKATLHTITNKSLIQTKLDVAPGSKQGYIFSYQLFLKKPSADVPLSFLTLSGKKSFFNTNQMWFNF